MNPAKIWMWISNPTVEGRIFWVSALLLFAEIAAIRWLGIEVSPVRTFPNLVLLVILVGASAGLGNPERLRCPPWLVMSAALLLVSGLIFAVPLGLAGLSLRLDQSEPVLKISLAMLALMAVVLMLGVLSISMGCTLGREMSKLAALRGYSINLAGSIAGVVIFAVISWLQQPPPVWLLAAGLMTWLLARRRLVLIAVGLFVALSLVTTTQSRWSPYSKIDILPLRHAAQSVLGEGNYLLNSNNTYFHFAVRILKLDSAGQERFRRESRTSAQLAVVGHYYRWLQLPFQNAPAHKRVLVLGGGSGNDASFALRNGAESIDVVEIDPVIARLGKTLHPDRPYCDPAVRLHVEDARTFLRYSRDKYDLIEFAYLDPGCTLNTASFIRVDNFVYTVESIRSALAHLNRDGLATISFATGPRHLVTRRLYQVINQAQGKPPLALVDDQWDSVLFFFGPGADGIRLDEASLRPLRIWPSPQDSIAARPATDDWPFLYLDEASGGVWLYVAVLLVAVLLPVLMLTTAREGPISGSAWGNMFFLGQAFMLVETKSITQLSLLFGATWLVTSVVTVAALTLAWLANWWAGRRKGTSVLPFYAVILVALLIDFLFKIPQETSVHFLLLSVVATVISCLPILFGGLVFSTCFRQATSPPMYLSANLLGVAVGGLTENLCLATGIKSLVLVAMTLYALSYLSLLLRRAEGRAK